MINLTIHNSNCLNYLKSLASDSVDVVVTSPPYNINVKYASYKDNRPETDYLTFLQAVFYEIYRILTPEGSFFLNYGSKSTNRELQTKVENLLIQPFGPELHDIKFYMQNKITWVKSISFDDTSRGHFNPINSSRFLNDCYEMVYHVTKTKKVPLDREAIGVPYKDKSNIKRYNKKGKDLRCRGNVWFIPYKTVQKSKNFPSAFPPELPEWCIKLHGVKNTSLVVDPFGGAGNTLLACAKLGVRGVAVDVDMGYCKIMVEKVKAFADETNMFAVNVDSISDYETRISLFPDNTNQN